MQVHPAIYGDIVVWVDRRGDHCLYGRNRSTSTIFKVTTGLDKVDLPAIYKDTIVWMDIRNGNGNIYGYHIPPSLLSSEVKPGVIESDVPLKGEPENGTCAGTSFLICIIFGSVPGIVMKKLK